LGSVLAVLAYFWRDLWSIGVGCLKALQTRNLAQQDIRVAGAIILGTLPICILGFILKPVLEHPNGLFRSLTLIGTASAIMGVLLFMAEAVSKRQRGLDNVDIKDGLMVGLGQALALIPGCSRSGSTLTVAMLLNMKREDAARFSFLLGIPAIALSGAMELKEMFGHGLNSAGVIDLGVGLISSAIVSYVSIAWLIKFLQNHSTWVFVWYRLAFGALVVALSSAGLIH
ncbi:MAG: undecaprenyl-diphosphate phosphatase, partial [Candidatus Melainabacteria bacterium]|nr:undecaprenyl-diphosphate phosphatase [Candidatus Melainabacteria bacterium]